MRELGIYIHIPFCKQKCYYCDFISFSNQESCIEDYINCVLKEIESEQEILRNCNISTIYFGGGTPSFIDSKYIKKIMEKLNILLLNQPQEITLEINPGTVDKEKLQQYKEMGINRVSMGLQTTNNQLLKQIGRIHTFEQFLETYRWVKEIGFKNCNVDLMLGLPEQRIEDLKQSLKEVIKLAPNHISIYSLILEEGTRLERLVHSGNLKLPEEEIERQMYGYVKNILELNGYQHYEISNFAQKGYESRHNVNCWKQKEYLGFGIAAHSYYENVRFSNTESLPRYLATSKEEFAKYNVKNLLEKANERDIEKDGLKIIHEIQKIQDKKKEYMLLGLRMLQGISITEFKQKFGENPIYLYRKELQKLDREKLIEIDLDTISLTRKGLDLANLVWEEFI